MPTEAETLAALVEAAKQIGEVTGRDLLEGMMHEAEHIRLEDRVGSWRWIHDRDAIDILESRVWRAVREWAQPEGYWYQWDNDAVSVADGDPYKFGAAKQHSEESPSALAALVAAIHKHWKESK